MINNRQPKRRPLSIDWLEDRLVLSATAASAATTAASNQAALITELNTVGSQINAAYASFATAIRQAESTFYTSTTGTGSTAQATLQSQITQQISTLSTALGTAVATLPATPLRSRACSRPS